MHDFWHSYGPGPTYPLYHTYVNSHDTISCSTLLYTELEATDGMVFDAHLGQSGVRVGVYHKLTTIQPSSDIFVVNEKYVTWDDGRRNLESIINEPSVVFQ